MKKTFIAAACLCAGICTATAQDYKVTVLETDEKMEQGDFEPTWQSLAEYETPEWFRDAKFGIFLNDKYTVKQSTYSCVECYYIH